VAACDRIGNSRGRFGGFGRDCPLANGTGKAGRAGAGLRALKIGLLIMAGFALLATIPAGGLPDYTPGEVPSDQPPQTGGREKQA
jgi:hypothetical protein